MPVYDANAAEQIGDEILLWTVPSYKFDHALCHAVTRRDRYWDSKHQCWVIDARHYDTLRRLVREHLGYELVVE